LFQACKEKIEEEIESTSERSSELADREQGNQTDLPSGEPVRVAQMYCATEFVMVGESQMSSSDRRSGMISSLAKDRMKH
jgi:hypothetical protein